MSHNQLPLRWHRSPRKVFILPQIPRWHPLRSNPIPLHFLPATAFDEIFDGMALQSRRCQVCASARRDGSESGDGDGKAAGVEGYGRGGIGAGCNGGGSDEIKGVILVGTGELESGRGEAQGDGYYRGGHVDVLVRMSRLENPVLSCSLDIVYLRFCDCRRSATAGNCFMILWHSLVISSLLDSSRGRRNQGTIGCFLLVIWLLSCPHQPDSFVATGALSRQLLVYSTVRSCMPAA